MAIVTYPLNGIDFYGEDAETYLCTRTSGVYSADDNFAASVTGDRQVSISKGLAWIRNTDFAGKSVCNTESVAIEIPIADGTRPRIDRIVLRFDKAANASSIVLKQGTPSSAPAAPTVERTELVYELGLCTVLVPAASTIVSAGDITSTLLDESVCGLMRDGVTGIPTAQLQEQTQALIDDLREVIAGVEAGSEVLLKAVYDPRGVEKDVFAQIPNPNLLDNSDFINVVNQRGKTSYNSAYTIDRWTLDVDGPIVEVVSGKGVKLSNGDPTYGAPLVQKVNPVSVSESRGNYTFSVCDDGGSIYSVTGKFTENSESITPWGKLLLTLYSGIPAVQIKLNQGQEKTFVWAKLELGDVVTPWEPKGYGAELSECMRYYQIRSVIYQGYQIKGITIQVPFDFHPMRTIPTGAFVGTTYYFNATFSTFDIRSFGAAVNLIVGVNDGIVAFQGNVALSADL